MVVSCANKVAPTGGMVDTEPPKVLSITPPDKSILFSSDKVEFEFDEFIELKEPDKQIFISPPLDAKPKYTVLKKKLIIEFTKPLKPNLTYTINFGGALRDIHEGNAIEGFKYIFSTGEYIDSLKITGTVVRADNTRPEKNTIALLYPASYSDSLIFNSIPEYYCLVDESGNFTLENLRNDEYLLVCINDKNNNYNAELPEEWVGYNDAPVIVKDQLNYKIRLFPQYPVKSVVVNAKKIGHGAVRVSFKGDGNKGNLGIVGGRVIYKKWSAFADTVDIYSDVLTDSIAVVYQVENKADTLWAYKADSKNKTVNSSGMLQIENVKRDGLDSLRLAFNYPVKFTSGGAERNQRSKLMLTPILYADSEFGKEFLFKRPDSTCLLEIIPGDFENPIGISNDTLIKEIAVLGERGSGIIELNIIPEREQNIIIQLLDKNEEIVTSFKINSPNKLEISEIAPGEYNLRAVADKNKNGKWDTGNYYERIQPERVYYYPEKITVRASWSIQLDWKLNNIENGN